MPTENRSSNTEQMVSVLEGYMLVERNIWTEQQVEAAAACITRLKVVPGMSDRDLAMAAIDAAQCKAPDVTLADFQPAAQHQGDPLCWSYKLGGEQRFYPTDPRKADFGGYAELMSDIEPLYRHPPTSDGFSAGDMADQGAKAFAARDGEVEELRRALGGMLFAFDDGVGRDWSRDLLDFARKIAPAAEFKADDK
ncbi:hypothetical protein [Pseudomonas sp. R5(2019)]|uniref:hypothetical protein n=1 Tax=Pseudomonas sp. R5(2019) TaxID=2697566 RepID=UPI002115AF7A|nr:hypothetical protein [Pseudomonas sp. R5(2019)]